MLRIFLIDRYILKELSLNVAASTLILMLIFGGLRFIHFLGKAARGDIPAGTVLSLASYESLGALVLLLPLAAFLAVILVLGRMGNDGETIALYACGVGRNHLLRVMLIFGVLLAMVVGTISLYLAPLALARGYRIEQQALLAAETTGLVAGDFKKTHSGERIFYAERLSKDQLVMKDIFIQMQQPDQKVIFRAKQGHLETDEENGNKNLILEDGYRYDLPTADNSMRISRYARHGLLVRKGGEREFNIRHKTIPTLKLWIMGAPNDISEVQWRLSMPISTLLLVMFAVPLTRYEPRKGRYSGLVSAIVTYLIYSNTIGIARHWIDKGIVSTIFGLWWVHIVMLMLVLVSLWPPRPLQKILSWLRSSLPKFNFLGALQSLFYLLRHISIFQNKK
ncbi:LPS export ABC transporter permease LptF [Candidatus Nitrosacidococcus sp. I8]|uniref:LPS export ABC transporter permease LptF n=1 Tax=Candidatus Nitrosacidococcus sp. I8 TaxID=2942908 RepID=UPI002227D1EA|nr:LPS export ABC transporter permease LptF [Candidatus Nitrosacidococcus sp. I8]CAH9018123.1 Lipopolysaccharide export system permease protein LptF [Candidatus Nitrosacidococcus sp. I8]